MTRVWTAEPNPLDGAFGAGTRGVWIPELMLFVIVGSKYSGGANAVVSSPDGTTWAGLGTPLGDYATDIAWAPTLGVSGRIVIVGGTLIHQAAYSDDGGSSWTTVTTPFDTIGAAYGVAWSASLGLFVMGGTSGPSNKVTATSPDGIVWTIATSSFDGAGNLVTSVLWVDDLALYIAGGYTGATGKVVMTSPNGTAWTARTTPMDGASGQVYGLAWLPFTGKVAAGGVSGDGATTLVTSANGTSGWAAVATPADGAGTVVAINEPRAGLILIGGLLGSDLIAGSLDDGATWTADTTPFDGQVNGFVFSDDLDLLLALASTGAASTLASTPISGPLPPNPVYSRIYGIQLSLSDDGVETVTSLVTSLDGIAS